MNNEELEYEILKMLAMSHDQMLSHVNKSFASREKHGGYEIVDVAPNPFWFKDYLSNVLANIQKSKQDLGGNYAR